MTLRICPARAVSAALAATVLSVLPSVAAAQSWPTKPIRMIAPYPPGGGPERVIRAITNGLGQRLGQPVVLDYKPGANGNIGATDLARSAPDGYTWMLAPETVVTINPLIYRNPGFKTEEVVPVNLIASLSQLLACHPSTGFKSVADMVARARTQDVTYASSGAGSAGHLTMELLSDSSKAKMTHIPYKGPAPAVQDLIGGQVQCSFLVASAVSEHVKAGRLLGLAASSKERSPALPDVPTLQEQGFRDLDATFWLGVFAPRGVPADAMSKFSKALDETIRSTEVKDAMAINGVRVEGTTPEKAQQELSQISKRWDAIVKRIQLRVE